MNKNLKEIFLKLIPIGIGGLLAYSFRGNISATPVDKWIVGLLGTCVGLLIIEFVRTSSKFDDLRKTIGEDKDKILTGIDALANIISDRTLDELKRARRLRASRTLKNLRELEKAWLDLCWSLEKSYVATNHIPDASIYSHGYAETALSIQALKKEVSMVSITKVFIVNNSKELDNISKTMQKQKLKDFDVRHIAFEKLPDHDHLETIDFGIFDSEAVLLWFLDPTTRKPIRGQVLTGEKNVKLFQEWFDQLLLESTKL